MSNYPTTSTVKEINWAYPSSTSAAAFGYSRSGCWVLKVGNVCRPLRSVFGHADKAQVEARAAIMDCPWSAATLYLRARGL